MKIHQSHQIIMSILGFSSSTHLQEMLLPTINPFYMQSTIWNVIIPNQNKKQCSAAFKSALHQVNDNQKKTGEI